jgi:hypothetical protein
VTKPTRIRGMLQHYKSVSYHKKYFQEDFFQDFLGKTKSDDILMTYYFLHKKIKMYVVPYEKDVEKIQTYDEWYNFQMDINNEKFVKKLKYKYEVKIRPDAHLLKITTLEELNTFNEKYKVKIEDLEDVNNDKEDYRIYNDKYGVLFPYWEKVCEDYDGMICLNYNEIFGQMFKENPERMSWWNWLDINCACIWRPSKVISSMKLL